MLFVVKGIRRTHGSAQTKKAPVRVIDLRKGLKSLGTSPIAVRDRALMLLGYAGGFRRAELAALEASDVQELPEGLVVTVRRSKADQEGRGRRTAIPYGSRIEKLALCVPCGHGESPRALKMDHSSGVS